MPNAPKTPHRHMRVETELWDAFGAAAQEVGSDRSTALREFMGWFARLPGVKLPRRPDASWTQGGHGRPETGRSEQV